VTQTPVTYVSPTAPASYSWEATDEAVAERYGVDIESIVRFDLNTSPEPPGLIADVLAAGRFETPLSEYPPSDYRRLVAAAADAYAVEPEELLVGAGAAEILDQIG
jgi:histidinol-phosphate/aromatic aminotransferase/cobyric acid decarboxylase-like protein